VVNSSRSQIEVLPKDLPMRRRVRVRERAESMCVLLAMAAFWVVVFVLNTLVGQAEHPLIR
jgi:hypothetical protein